MSSKVRSTNLELLRIVAIFLVLLVHYLPARTTPSAQTLIQNPWETILNLELRSISFVCVNVFIIISGYFGIRWKLKSLKRLTYTIVFITISAYLLRLIFERGDYNILNLPYNAIDNFCHWFVAAYLGLYMFAPMINSFIEKVSINQLGKYILIFYGFSTLFGYFFYSWFGSPKDFFAGMSILSFIGLYLIGAFINRANDIKYFCYSAWKYFLIYLLLGFALVLVSLVLLKVGIKSSVYGYLNPIIILESVCLFLSFRNLKIKNITWINYVAGSAFAVYVFHCDRAIGGIISKCFEYIEATYQYPLLIAFLFFIVIYLVAMFFDKLTWYVYQISKKFYKIISINCKSRKQNTGLG